MTDDEFKMDVVDRLARIETKLKTWKDKIHLNRYLIMLLYTIIAGVIIRQIFWSST